MTNGVLRAIGHLWPTPVVPVLWELITRGAEPPAFPPPSRIAAAMYTMWLTGPAERLWLSDAAPMNIPARRGGPRAALTARHIDVPETEQARRRSDRRAG